ncbi:acyl-CoA carboxylase subunit epsilon [Streptomyces sp. NPDC088725]|uniref:acyl-CoA carboxylase subunit epsilon n=1 Tax=Streptomyces sp. NPDC088725 TaxID=3365873 RepID=UPI00382EE9EF
MSEVLMPDLDIRVERGHPTHDELAAVVALLLKGVAPSAAPPQTPPGLRCSWQPDTFDGAHSWRR